VKSWFGEQLSLFHEEPSRETNSRTRNEPAYTNNSDTHTSAGEEPRASAQPPVYNAQLFRRAGSDLNEGTT
jgi:hypothetical protein